MKKGIALTLIAVLVLALGLVVYADSNNEVPNWFVDMIQWKKDQVDKGVSEGVITTEEAFYLKNRSNNMERYYNENGFDYNVRYDVCTPNDSQGCHGNSSN